MSWYKKPFKAVRTGLSTIGDVISDGGIIPYEEKKKQEKAATSGAADTVGRIHREEFDNWMDQFLPVDRKLMDMASTNTNNLQEEQAARDHTQASFSMARKADNLNRAGLGVALAPDEQQYIDGRSQRAEAAATARNVNNTRIHADDRDKAIMSGGMTGGLRDLAQGFKQ